MNFPWISVSQKGAQFLSSSTPAHQPKLVLQVTNEMVDDEEHEGTSGKFGELKGLATFEYEGFSEVGISKGTRGKLLMYFKFAERELISSFFLIIIVVSIIFCSSHYDIIY